MGALYLMRIIVYGIYFGTPPPLTEAIILESGNLMANLAILQQLAFRTVARNPYAVINKLRKNLCKAQLQV